MAPSAASKPVKAPSQASSASTTAAYLRIGSPQRTHQGNIEQALVPRGRQCSPQHQHTSGQRQYKHGFDATGQLVHHGTHFIQNSADINDGDIGEGRNQRLAKSSCAASSRKLLIQLAAAAATGMAVPAQRNSPENCPRPPHAGW
jgi:hypothetical protein